MSTTTVLDTSSHQAAQSRWAVETHGLTKRFGENVAMNGVELLVPRGCAFGYLGPNGAGKTTLIRVCMAFERPNTAIWHWRGLAPSWTSLGSTAI